MNEIHMMKLEGAGIDVHEALSRFMNNEGLLKKFLLRFPQDQNYAKLKQAFADRDKDAAFTAAHTLKGVTGNLSMKRLFALLSDMVERLRVGDLVSAEQQLDELEREYDMVLDALKVFDER